MKEKIVVYGLGKFYASVRSFIEREFCIVGYSDRKKVQCEGYVSASDIHRLEYEYVLITSTDYYEEIKNELVNKHEIPEHKVISVNELIIKTYQLELGGVQKTNQHNR